MIATKAQAESLLLTLCEKKQIVINAQFWPDKTTNLLEVSANELYFGTWKQFQHTLPLIRATADLHSTVGEQGSLPSDARRCQVPHLGKVKPLES